MIKLVQGCWSRGFKRHPLLQTSSPLEHQPRTYIEIGTMNGGTSHEQQAQNSKTLVSIHDYRQPFNLYLGCFPK